jgi:hypothetical protein
VRWIALVAGVALIVLAVAAATRVEDTREGLIAEIVTLLAGAAGVSVLIYGLAARRGLPQAPPPGPPPGHSAAPAARSRRDMLLGGGGIALSLILVTGLAMTGGLLWAALGLALLLPMLSGSIYLCVRYVRAGPATDRISPTR